MKKVLYLIAAALVTVVACNKNTPDPKPDPTPDPTPTVPDLTLSTPKIVDVDGESSIYTVKFNAGKAWTATLSYPDGSESGAVLAKEKGGAADGVELKVTFQGLTEEQMGRLIQLDLKAGSTTESILFFQGLVFLPDNEEEVPTIPAAGGKYNLNILTNMDVTIKKYDGAEEAFPWAPVTFNQDEAAHKISLAFNVAANTGYDARTCYVKFTMPEIQVPVLDDEGAPTGETADMVTRFYVNQAGNAQAAYTVALPEDIEHGANNENSNVTLAYFNGMVLMSDGVTLRAYNPDNGALVTAPAVPETLPVQCITNDDAGNVLFANGAAYGETINVYAVKADATDFKKAVVVATGVVSAWTGAPIVDNVRAKGDVFGNAVISVISGGGAYFENTSYGMYWEIKGGVAGEAAYLACPSDITDTIWLSNRACFAPAGDSASAGFFYIGYDGVYALNYYNGTAWVHAVETGCAGNESFNAIASTSWNNKSLVAFVEMFCFPFSWSADSAIWLVDVSDASAPKVISHAPVPMIEDAIPATDSNREGSTSDILLHVEGDSLAVYVVDSSLGVFHKQVYGKQ